MQDRRRQIDRLLLERENAQKALDHDIREFNAATAEFVAVDEAREVAKSVAAKLQQKAHDSIASVVSRCLSAVFDDPYEFRIDFVEARGKTEARLQFIRDGLKLEDPLNEVGGGVIDVASLALRVACLLLSRPQLRRVLILDEPWKNIRGEGNRRRTREMLLRMADDLKIQFIINTDIDAYRLGTVIELGES